jgi:biopolymer transport protein ExbB
VAQDSNPVAPTAAPTVAPVTAPAEQTAPTPAGQADTAVSAPQTAQAATVETNANGELQVNIPQMAKPGENEAPVVSAQSLIQNNEALALTKMGFNHLLQQSDIVGLSVLFTLSAMSVFTWYYICFNTFRSWVVKRRTASVMRNFWDANTSQDAVNSMETEPDYEPFSKIALAAASAAAHHADSKGGRMAEALSRQEFIDRAISQSATRETAKFDSGLTLLATVGSTAPFVGLFGTVWGIYHALVGIGAQKRVSMDVVAGPVGEALIMTCIGLGVAIPSVLAYNFFVRSNNKIKGQVETFSKDLFDFFATGERVRMVKYGARQSEPRVV